MWRSWSILLVGCAGCQAFDASLLRDAASHDGSELDAGPACSHAAPPERIESTAPDTGDALFALRGIELSLAEAWATTGYDLDGICTQPPEPMAECSPAVRSGAAAIDGPGGVDNSLGRDVIPLILTGFPTLDDTAQASQEIGLNALLVGVRDWNGTDDDPSVTATLVVAVFGTGAPEPPLTLPRGYPDGGLRYDTDAEPTPRFVGIAPPRWDGNDVFFAPDDAFVGKDPCCPRVVDDRAFIAGRTLVVHLPNRTPITFGGLERAVTFRLTDALLVLQLNESLDAVDHAILAGRWAVVDILSITEAVGICKDSDTFTQVERVLQLAADLRSTPGSGGPGVLCDAVSVGVRFNDGRRARLGGVLPPLASPTPCAIDAGL